MTKTRSAPWIGLWLLPIVLQLASRHASGGNAQETPPSRRESQTTRVPLLLGIALDEVGIAQADLMRSKDLVLTLLEALPPGSKMALASFSGDKRIVLPATSDRSLLAPALEAFAAQGSAVALPDGLFDMIEYLGTQDADSRALLLVSTGRVREGDLQFEDPLNAAVAKKIPIFSLALGQGDGKMLRRIAKITGGEYVRLEVAEASMLAQLLARDERRAETEAAANPEPKDAARTETGPATGLLGAAAVFFSLGGVLLLAIVVLLVRRMNATPPIPAKESTGAAPSVPPRANLSLGSTSREDETLLEKTLVVNADPILRALSGPGAGKNFPLSASGHTSLGRSRRNDIVVPEDAASAQHCRIDREGDSYVLHDLGATNGTWVNGSKTERAVLQHGDRLKVGETVFTVSLFGDRS